MPNSEIQAQIDTLRTEYQTANGARRLEIEKEAKSLQGKLKKCYHCATVLPDNHPAYFCTTICQDGYWSAAKRPENHRWTMEEMRKQIEQWQRNAELKKHLK